MTTPAATAPDQTATREENPWARAWRRLRRRRGAMVALAVVVLFIALALLAPLLAPYDPVKTNFMLVRKPPTWEHWNNWAMTCWIAGFRTVPQLKERPNLLLHYDGPTHRKRLNSS